jgi:hypothetical protein
MEEDVKNREKRSTQARIRTRRLKDANVPLPTNVTSNVISLIENAPNVGIKTTYLKEVFLSKFVSSDTAPANVRRQRAINKWLSVERENEATNDRLLILEGTYNILPRVSLSSLKDLARSRIAKVLGDTVPLDALFGGFSGGASTTKLRTESHPAQKYLGKAEITSAARWWFDLVLEESPLWKGESNQLFIEETKGNILFTVPKTTEIDRCAAKEPDLNMYLQKGVGNYIRRRLRRYGINLNDQTINQRLAREGSITGRLATLDLSSASDSLTVGCVAELLPPIWYGFLSDIRSPYTQIDGEWHENHMFSSMGNGFTFELESLIFWALSCAVRDLCGCSGVVSVYGDDIIVESEIYEALSWVLNVFGFSVNDDKSFSTGPFRESCGGHYHDGYDISPFYLKGPLLKIRDAIVLANHVRKWSEIPDTGVLHPALQDLWSYLKSLVPRELWGGVDLGSDSQIVSNDRPKKRLVAVSEKRDNGLGGYLLWLDVCGDRPEDVRDYIVITGSERALPIGKYRVRRVNADGWYPHATFFNEDRHGNRVPGD